MKDPKLLGSIWENTRKYGTQWSRSTQLYVACHQCGPIVPSSARSAWRVESARPALLHFQRPARLALPFLYQNIDTFGSSSRYTLDKLLKSVVCSNLGGLTKAVLPCSSALRTEVLHLPRSLSKVAVATLSILLRNYSLFTVYLTVFFFEKNQVFRRMQRRSLSRRKISYSSLHKGFDFRTLFSLPIPYTLEKNSRGT